MLSRVWTLPKLFVLMLMAGFVLLALEIRFEHRVVLGETRLAWTPIVYSLAMLPIGAIGLWRWENGGRKLLRWAFGAALIVGAMGVWFHAQGRGLSALIPVLSAWRLPIGTAGSAPEGMPPILAPFSFFGLGAMGVLACSRGFSAMPVETDVLPAVVSSAR